jgi:hypothetical protein
MTAAAPQPRMQVQLSDDKSRATIEFLPASGVTGSLTVDVDQLLTLVRSLGQVRGQMAAGRPAPPLEGIQLEVAFNTQWYIQPEPLTEGSLLSFYHPAFGPVGFLVPREQVAEMVRLLTKHLEAPPMTATQKQN